MPRFLAICIYLEDGHHVGDSLLLDAPSLGDALAMDLPSTSNLVERTIIPAPSTYTDERAAFFVVRRTVPLTDVSCVTANAAMGLHGVIEVLGDLDTALDVCKMIPGDVYSLGTDEAVVCVKLLPGDGWPVEATADPNSHEQPRTAKLVETLRQAWALLC